MTDHDERRVEQMLRTAKTKADLEDLVRMLDRRNITLQRVRDRFEPVLGHLDVDHPAAAAEAFGQ